MQRLTTPPHLAPAPPPPSGTHIRSIPAPNTGPGTCSMSEGPVCRDGVSLFIALLGAGPSMHPWCLYPPLPLGGRLGWGNDAAILNLEDRRRVGCPGMTPPVRLALVTQVGGTPCPAWLACPLFPCYAFALPFAPWPLPDGIAQGMSPLSEKACPWKGRGSAVSLERKRYPTLPSAHLIQGLPNGHHILAGGGGSALRPIIIEDANTKELANYIKEGPRCHPRRNSTESKLPGHEGRCPHIQEGTRV